MRLENLFLMTVFAICVLVTAGTATAQDSSDSSRLTLAPTETKNTQQQAELFFKKCLAAPVISTNEETDAAFCACAAINMHDWLEKPAKLVGKEFFSPVESKELTKQVLMSEIYGPCLHLPVYDLSLEECTNDPRYVNFMQQGNLLEATCQCVATGDSQYFEKYAKAYIDMQFSQGKDVDDPIREIERDINFYKAHGLTQKDCYTEYSNKLRNGG